MNLDEQLLEITEILNKHDVFYWIDSGTLLGIVREGKLLSGDIDIDISIPYTEKENVLSLLPDFEGVGYSFKETWSYKSNDYIFKLVHKERDRIIDFKFTLKTKKIMCGIVRSSLTENQVIFLARSSEK